MLAAPAAADCDKLPPPVLPFHNVSFSYSGNKEGLLYKDLEFGIDCDSCVCMAPHRRRAFAACPAAAPAASACPCSSAREHSP